MKRRTIENIFFVTLFIMLCSLGFWQLSRLAQKEALIDKIEDRLSKPAIALNSLPKITAQNIEDFEFTKVSIDGKLIDNIELHRVGKYYKNKIGLHIFSVIKTTNGKNVIVNRGWVPDDWKKAEDRKQPLNKNVASAAIRKSGKEKWFTPINDPAANYWFWIDLPSMAKQLESKYNLQDVENTFYLVALADNTVGLPKPASAKPKLLNDHLQYAITWFTLALILVLMSVYYRRKNS